MKIKPSVFFKFLLLFVAILNTVSAEEKKKLKLVLDKWDNVKESENILKTNVTFDKVEGEEVKINGIIIQAIDVDDNYKITVDITYSPEKDGEYKKVFGIAKMGVCRIMANHYKKYLYESLKNYANAPDPDKCPVIQETYTITNYPLDSSKFQKYLRIGYYRIVAYLIQQEEELLQYVVEGHTETE